MHRYQKAQLDEQDIAMNEFRQEGISGSRSLSDFIENDGQKDIYEEYRNTKEEQDKLAKEKAQKEQANI